MLFFVVMGGVVVGGVYMGVAGLINANEPTYWGTFTEDRCSKSKSKINLNALPRTSPQTRRGADRARAARPDIKAV